MKNMAVHAKESIMLGMHTAGEYIKKAGHKVAETLTNPKVWDCLAHTGLTFGTSLLDNILLSEEEVDFTDGSLM